MNAQLGAITWPNISFGPVNLWSLHPIWKRDPTFPAAPATARNIPRSDARHDNPLLRQALAHR